MIIRALLKWKQKHKKIYMLRPIIRIRNIWVNYLKQPRENIQYGLLLLCLRLTSKKCENAITLTGIAGIFC